MKKTRKQKYEAEVKRIMNRDIELLEYHFNRIFLKSKIEGWFIYLNFGRNPEYYFLNSTNLDISDEELELCIFEQIYKEMAEEIKNEK